MNKLRLLELVATLLYAASVILFGFSPESNSLIFKAAWICSCIACPLYVIYFKKVRLYSDMFEMGTYIPLNFIGLFGVLFYSVNFIPPEFTLGAVLIYSIGAVMFLTPILATGSVVLAKKIPKIFPPPRFIMLDAFTTAASFVATALLIMWSPITWVFWIVIDALAIYIYFKTKSFILMASYILYLINSFRGICNWLNPGFLPF